MAAAPTERRPYIIGRGGAIPLEETIGPRTPIRVEPVVRFRMTTERLLQEFNEDTQWDFIRASDEGTIEYGGINTNDGAITDITGPLDVLRELFTTPIRIRPNITIGGIQSTIRRGEEIYAARAVRFTIESGRFLVETTDTREAFMKATEGGTVIDMSGKKPGERIIVGPAQTIQELFPDIKFEPASID